MALIGNIELKKSEINQTWILSEINPKGWHFSTEKIDILKFTESSNLEMISIQEGSIRKISYQLNNDKEIILDSGVNFGKIKSITKNQLIIQHGDDNSKTEKIYSLLPDTKLEYSETEIIEEIKNHKWKAEIERPNNKGIMTWTLEENKEDDFEFLLTIGSNQRKVKMFAKLNKIDNCFFLSCQIPDFQTSENYMLPLIKKDEIQLSFGAGEEQKIVTFKKEK